MKTTIKTLAIIVAMICLNLSASATTIIACGTTLKLTANQVTYLHSLRIPAIEIALKCDTVKYNDTADMILKLIKNHK